LVGDDEFRFSKKFCAGLLQVAAGDHDPAQYLCCFFGAGNEEPGMNGEIVNPGGPESFEFARTLKFRRPATMA